jgi:hypothetical protein
MIGVTDFPSSVCTRKQLISAALCHEPTNQQTIIMDSGTYNTKLQECQKPIHQQLAVLILYLSILLH